MLVLKPGGPIAQLGNLWFFCSALVSDVLLIRLFLVLANVCLLTCEHRWHPWLCFWQRPAILHASIHLQQPSRFHAASRLMAGRPTCLPLLPPLPQLHCWASRRGPVWGG